MLNGQIFSVLISWFILLEHVTDMVTAWQEFEGRALRVNAGPPPPRREDSSFRGDSSFRVNRGGGSFGSANCVHVGNLAWGVDDLALENLFSEQGKVMEARLVYDRESGRSRGFGFVTYSSAEEVNSAIEYLNGVVSILSLLSLSL